MRPWQLPLPRSSSSLGIIFSSAVVLAVSASLLCNKHEAQVLKQNPSIASNLRWVTKSVSIDPVEFGLQGCLDFGLNFFFLRSILG